MTAGVRDSLDPQISLLDQWVAARREINALEAKAARLLGERLAVLDADAALFPMQRETVHRSMVGEYVAAGRMAKGSVEFAFEDARMLAQFPVLQKAFEAGSVSAQHVRHIVRAVGPLLEGVREGTIEPAVIALFEQAALEFAEAESPSRTDTHVKELVAAFAPDTVVEQCRRGEKERRAWMRSFDDGVSILHLILPTAKAVAIMDRTRAIAREALAASDPAGLHVQLPVDWDAEFASWNAREELRGLIESEHWSLEDDPIASAAYDAEMDAALRSGPTPVQIEITADERTLDQVQADAICDLLLGANPTEIIGAGLDGITAQLQVTIKATTLAGLDDHPALLNGHGPIDPDVARSLAGENNGWTRLFLDPTGLVISTDTYTPTAAMKRFLAARDQHCRFPGCQQPVHRCQIDHTHDHALGGSTDIHNLAHLCLTHHALKHPDIPDRFRWTATQHPDWTITWTSPTGRAHQDRPPRRVMFV